MSTLTGQSISALRMLALATLLLLAGCNGSVVLTDAEKLEKAKRCTDAGLIPLVYPSVVTCVVPGGIER
jgi:hypothetical protein